MPQHYNTSTTRGNDVIVDLLLLDCSFSSKAMRPASSAHGPVRVLCHCVSLQGMHQLQSCRSTMSRCDCRSCQVFDSSFTGVSRTSLCAASGIQAGGTLSGKWPEWIVLHVRVFYMPVTNASRTLSPRKSSLRPLHRRPYPFFVPPL